MSKVINSDSISPESHYLTKNGRRQFLRAHIWTKTLEQMRQLWLGRVTEDLLRRVFSPPLHPDVLSPWESVPWTQSATRVSRLRKPFRKAPGPTTRLIPNSGPVFSVFAEKQWSESKISPNSGGKWHQQITPECRGLWMWVVSPFQFSYSEYAFRVLNILNKSYAKRVFCFRSLSLSHK